MKNNSTDYTENRILHRLQTQTQQGRNAVVRQVILRDNAMGRLTAKDMLHLFAKYAR